MFLVRLERQSHTSFTFPISSYTILTSSRLSTIYKDIIDHFPLFGDCLKDIIKTKLLELHPYDNLGFHEFPIRLGFIKNEVEKGSLDGQTSLLQHESMPRYYYRGVTGVYFIRFLENPFRSNIISSPRTTGLSS